MRWQAELAKLRTTLTGPEPAELAAITTASMALTRGHVRVRALTGQPMTVARFAAALTTISKSGGVWVQIVWIGLKWFWMEMGMSVLVRGYRQCWANTGSGAAGVVSRWRVAFVVDGLLFVRAASALASFSASP
ncbi:MAG: hypothetical protein M3325_02970 [Actinomycetota bacterium]|nr:hypothetical protein [Actinomycetota bacterium]